MFQCLLAFENKLKKIKFNFVDTATLFTNLEQSNLKLDARLPATQHPIEGHVGQYATTNQISCFFL